MIRESIPKDIRKYKTKFLAGFTLREFGSIAASAGLAIFLYNIQPETSRSYELCLPAMIPLLFGFWSPMDMPLEKYIQTTFISRFIAPKERLYKIDNVYSKYVSNDAIDIKSNDINDLNGKKKKDKKINSKKIKKMAIKESLEYKGYK